MNAESILFALIRNALLGEAVDKKVVAYKNPGKTFSNPYTSSIYSGMMFNYYC